MWTGTVTSTSPLANTVISRGHFNRWCPMYVESELASLNATRWSGSSAASPSVGSLPITWCLFLWTSGGRSVKGNGPWMWQLGGWGVGLMSNKDSRTPPPPNKKKKKRVKKRKIQKKQWKITRKINNNNNKQTKPIITVAGRGVESYLPTGSKDVYLKSNIRYQSKLSLIFMNCGCSS